MNREHILSVLYDLALTIGGEVRLSDLLTRVMRRLQFHTSFPAGMVLLNQETAGDHIRSEVALVVGDHVLARSQGDSRLWPASLVQGALELITESARLAQLDASRQYGCALKLPIDAESCIVLLSPQPPASSLPLTQLFLPILANLSRAIMLCRNHERMTRVLETDRDQARAQLQEHQQGTLTVLRNLMDGVLQIDGHGTIKMVNHAVLGLFGYSEEELLGQNVRMLMPEPYRSEHDGYLLRYFQERQPRVIGRRREVVGMHRNGGGFPLELTVTEMNSPGGPLFIGVLRDISSRKALEKAQENARHEAERIARVKSEFLANMSHEIRTPLNAVLGLARKGQRENVGRKTGETCGQILEAGQYLLGVINDILDFSKIEAGKVAIENRPFRLREAIDDACRMTSDRARAKGLEMICDCPDVMPEWVEGDLLRLKQILVNLLSNAVKFTEQGQVRLCVDRLGEYIRFQISDTGIGMTAEQCARLFTPFEQADSSTTRQFGGTGLGLAISQNLAVLMGGHIEVISELGQGSQFSVLLSLPVALPDADIAALVPATTGSRLKGLYVLAAEDVPFNRLVLEDVLLQEGARVDFAEHGLQAVRKVTEQEGQVYDLVLMDIQMPVMNGYEATRRICELAPKLPVIGLTAHAMPSELNQCLAAGMVAYVTKPIDQETLVASILKHLKPRLDEVPVLSEAASPVPEQPSTSGHVIDWTVLSKRYQGQQAFIGRLLNSIVQSHGETPAKLRTAIAGVIYADIAFHAHSLKGMAGHLQVESVMELAKQAEQEARKDSTAALQLAEQLAMQVDELLDVVKQRLALQLPS